MNDALYLRAVGIAAAVQPDYSFSLPAVRALARMGRLRLEKPVTFLVGENGVGKSTLMEALAIAMGFNPEGGTINFRFSTADSHSELYRGRHAEFPLLYRQNARGAVPLAGAAARPAPPPGWFFPSGRKLLQCCHRDRPSG